MSGPLVLIVGNGGREHALAWKLAGDSSCPRVVIAPGNAGTAGAGENVEIAATDVEGLVGWADANRPALTVIGPEAPLCAGLADRLEERGHRVFGPGAAAARLEGSKVFSKEIMEAAGVPTARAASFTDLSEALAYVRAEGAPIVVKADGLAAGKGVTVCLTVEEAEGALRDALERGVFGEAGGGG
ncbi:MAG TPA: phosphoribosylamine--glycine ligase, partial [Kiritimatiellia bacterium]|nr:phosphoribosylamine--glycine ligase [Kiritimatiellia bacterium]